LQPGTRAQQSVRVPVELEISSDLCYFMTHWFVKKIGCSTAGLSNDRRQENADPETLQNVFPLVGRPALLHAQEDVWEQAKQTMRRSRGFCSVSKAVPAATGVRYECGGVSAVSCG